MTAFHAIAALYIATVAIMALGTITDAAIRGLNAWKAIQNERNGK